MIPFEKVHSQARVAVFLNTSCLINFVVLFDLLDVLATAGLVCGGHVGGGWISSMSRKKVLV